eukprot:15334368-Ditylum_brightwellii.AAC.1
MLLHLMILVWRARLGSAVSRAHVDAVEVSGLEGEQVSVVLKAVDAVLLWCSCHGGSGGLLGDRIRYVGHTEAS